MIPVPVLALLKVSLLVPLKFHWAIVVCAANREVIGKKEKASSPAATAEIQEVFMVVCARKFT
jgi:hypothetical protein